MIEKIKKGPKEGYPIGYKLREIEAESKFSQEIKLALIEQVVPLETINQVLVAEGLQTERERKLNLWVTVLLIIMINIYTTEAIGAVLEKIGQGLRYIWPDPRLSGGHRQCDKLSSVSSWSETNGSLIPASMSALGHR